MTRAILMPFHLYTPFGSEFYEPILDFQLKTLEKYQDEFDKVYLIDSEWNIDFLKVVKRLPLMKFKILKKELDGHHWVQFKWAIPKIEQENMLFLDNDVLIFKPGVIDGWFKKIEEGYDFLGSFDGSGTNLESHSLAPWMKEKGYSRMGSYYFILTKKLLDKIGDYDFSPMPEKGFDSFGEFTVKMLKTNPKIYEIEDYRDEQPHDYYHIRAGSRIPYLLASKHSENNQHDYWNNLKSQPHSEILRQAEWYKRIGGNIDELLEDMKNV